MSNLAWLLLPCVLLLVFGYSLRRANELFAVSAQAGKLELLRGRLPQALFADLADIAEREQLDGVELRVVSESATPRLAWSGEPHPAAEQAARNVIGRYDLTRIRSGRLRAR